MDKSALFKISYGLYVLGVNTDNGFGGCIIDAFMQVTANPTVAVLASIQKNYSNESIKKYKEFTVSVLSKDVDPFVVSNFGFQSGRAVKKWANVPHTVVEGLPVLSDCAAHYRLKITHFEELSTHTLFFCDIIDSVMGEGEPLTYAYYQAEMKNLAMDAFKKFKGM